MTSKAAFHRTILVSILKDIFKDQTIAPYLGFKGGTAAMLFYELPRFSVDLGFDLRDDPNIQTFFDTIKKILQKYGIVKKADNKRYTLFFLLSYEGKQEGVSNIKVEISKRKYGSHYEVANFLGIPMRVMVKSDMAAHKLMAMHNRLGHANRDIYDVWFFLDSRWPVNGKIVESVMAIPYKDFLSILIEDLEKYDDRRILTGLGELLTPMQRKWVQQKLKDETIFQLRLLREHAF